MGSIEPRNVSWEDVIGAPVPEPSDSLGLGHKIHGSPVKAYDGAILWVESYQWQILPDGSREPRRYRVMGLIDKAVGDGKRTEPFPFDSPGLVMEYGTEQEARDLLVKRAHGRV